MEGEPAIRHGDFRNALRPLESERGEREDVDPAPIGELQLRGSRGAPKLGALDHRQPTSGHGKPRLPAVDGELRLFEASYGTDGSRATPDRRGHNERASKKLDQGPP